MFSDNAQDAPRYILGAIAVLAPSVVTIILAALTSISRRRNKEADEGKRIIEVSETFRYTL
jgi:hypothetical protein